jgi:hypothetical protein
MSIEPAGFSQPNMGYKYANTNNEVGKAATGVGEIVGGFQSLEAAYRASIKYDMKPLNKQNTLNKILYTFSRIMSGDWNVFRKSKNDHPTIAPKKAKNQPGEQPGQSMVVPTGLI